MQTCFSNVWPCLLDYCVVGLFLLTHVCQSGNAASQTVQPFGGICVWICVCFEVKLSLGGSLPAWFAEFGAVIRLKQRIFS